jgi:hypothetical protein
VKKDSNQKFLWDVGDSDDWDEASKKEWQKEWNDMPEFVNEDTFGIRQLIVHFKTNEDVAIFANLIEQNITRETRYIWFPKVQKAHLTSLRYRSES